MDALTKDELFNADFAHCLRQSFASGGGSWCHHVMHDSGHKLHGSCSIRQVSWCASVATVRASASDDLDLGLETSDSQSRQLLSAA